MKMIWNEGRIFLHNMQPDFNSPHIGIFIDRIDSLFI